MNYKISIIIPIHNIEKYLSKTLDSILSQSIGHENIEVIMVNDCSTDKSPYIINEYADKYNNFKALHLTENSGLPGKPRNIGIKQSNGDYLMFMDHDDFYSEDMCEILYDKITNEKADIVFCNYNYVFDDNTIKKRLSDYNKSEIKIKHIKDNNQFLALPPSIWTKIYKRKFITENDIHFPEGILGEDLSFFIHSLLKAEGIIYLNDYHGYNYRIRDSERGRSTIHIKNKKYLNAMILGYINTYNILKHEKKEYYFPIIFEGHLRYWMNCFITGNTSKSEKKELLHKIELIFKKQSQYGFEADYIHLKLFEKIVNKKFDDAILISEISYELKKREQYFQNKHEKLTINMKNLKKANQDLESLLNSKKKQVSDLQTTKGWLSYKTENIFIRLKNKIKN